MRAGHSLFSAFLRFSPPAPFGTAARLTAFVPGFACTPTATFESAVPSGDGDTWRSFAVFPVVFSAERVLGAGDVGYVLGVDGWRGWEGSGGMGEDDFEYVEGGGTAVAAAGVGLGAGVEEVEAEAEADVDAIAVDVDVDGDSEGASELDGVLNSAGRTWEISSACHETRSNCTKNAPLVSHARL